MTVDKNDASWVYVFVSKSGVKETFLGLYNEEQEVNFIPAFASKDDANECFLTMPREKGIKYEVQAVHVEELEREATQNQFVVALVDKNGKIIK